jgi:hypothetical protein
MLNDYQRLIVVIGQSKIRATILSTGTMMKIAAEFLKATALKTSHASAILQSVLSRCSPKERRALLKNAAVASEYPFAF